MNEQSMSLIGKMNEILKDVCARAKFGKFKQKYMTTEVTCEKGLIMWEKA